MEHLLYLLLDQVRMLVWMQSKDGHRGKNRPKPMSPLANKRHADHGIRKGKTDRPAEDVARLLDAVAKGQQWRPHGQVRTTVNGRSNDE